MKDGNKKKIHIKKEKAITLISLIITVVVLFVLAGITINIILDNSAIEKAKDTVNKMENQSHTMNSIRDEIRNQIQPG